MSILPIRIYPDPVLRVRCAEVEAFDEDLKSLAESMVATMHAAPGIGLAASQIGVEMRLAVVDITAGESAEAIHVFVNPEIIETTGKDIDEEGCLSIPGITEKVSRPAAVKVRAQDLAGNSFETEADGLFARAICHEVDHLNGVLFVDRLVGLKKELVRRQLRRIGRQQEVEA